MRILRQLVAMFVAISLLTPATTGAAPSFLKTSPYFRDQVFKYDAQLGFFVNKTDYPDNICRHVYDYSLSAMLAAARKKNAGCAGAYYVPPTASIAIPQVVYGASTGGKTAAPSGMRSQRAHIPRYQLAYIAEAAADAMQSPAAFTRLGVAFDRCGRPAGVFSESAVKCDALGWILKKACDELAVTAKNRGVAYRASELINEEVLALSGRSIVALNDEEGRTAVVAALREAVKRFRDT